MTKIRDADDKSKSVSKRGKDHADEDKINTSTGDAADESNVPRIFDLFCYGRKFTEEGAMGRDQRMTDLSSHFGNPLSSNNNANNRRRRTESFFRMILVTVVVVAFVTALVLTLRIVVFTPNGESRGDTDKLIESIGESPVSPPSYEDDKDPSMVIIEVTERSLTSIEINEGIEKDVSSLARASVPQTNDEPSTSGARNEHNALLNFVHGILLLTCLLLLV